MTNLVLLTRTSPSHTQTTYQSDFWVAARGTLAGPGQTAFDATPVQLDPGQPPAQNFLMAARATAGQPGFSTQRAPQSPPPPIVDSVTILIKSSTTIKPEGIDLGGGAFIFTLDFPGGIPTLVSKQFANLQNALAAYTYGDAFFHMFNVSANGPVNLANRTIAIPTDLSTTALGHLAPVGQPAH